MPRYSKNSEERWIHPNYRKAYVFKYSNGMAYTSVDSKREATGYYFLPKNKRVIMEILNSRLNAKSLPLEIAEKTILELVQRFKSDKMTKLHPNTIAHYNMIFKEFFDKNYSLSDVVGIRDRILTVRSSLKLADNTIRKRFVRLKSLFKFGIELEWMTKNPIVSGMVPTYKKRKVVIATNEEIQILINHFNSINNFKMAYLIEVASLTGMRMQELLDIRWNDIRAQDLVIHGKGSRERNFPINAFPRLNEIFNILKAKGLESPFPWKAQQVPARRLKEAIAKIKAQSEASGDLKDLSHISMHVIRKSTVNLWKKKGISFEYRNKVMGHSREIEKDHYLLDPELEEIVTEILSKM